MRNFMANFVKTLGFCKDFGKNSVNKFLHVRTTNQRDGSNDMHIKKTVKNKKESSATLLNKIS